jgi:type I restriction enzyme S subunit
VTDSHVTTLRADASKIARPYFAYSLKRLQPVIEAAANGSTGQVELSRPYLEGIKFVVPDSDLQDMFGDLVSPISEKQALAEAENRELTSLRDWLLPMLMNGQVTVGK